MKKVQEKKIKLSKKKKKSGTGTEISASNENQPIPGKTNGRVGATFQNDIYDRLYNEYEQ